MSNISTTSEARLVSNGVVAENCHQRAACAAYRLPLTCSIASYHLRGVGMSDEDEGVMLYAAEPPGAPGGQEDEYIQAQPDLDEYIQTQPSYSEHDA